MAKQNIILKSPEVVEKPRKKDKTQSNDSDKQASKNLKLNWLNNSKYMFFQSLIFALFWYKWLYLDLSKHSDSYESLHNVDNIVKFSDRYKNKHFKFEPNVMLSYQNSTMDNDSDKAKPLIISESNSKLFNLLLFVIEFYPIYLLIWLNNYDNLISRFTSEYK